MAAKLLLSLLLLMLATGAQLIRFKDAEDDPNSEIVFNISDTSVVENTFINVTCGLKTNDKTMSVGTISVTFEKAISIKHRTVRSLCSGQFDNVGGMQACRTNNTLVVRNKVMAKHAGMVSCRVKWGNWGNQGNGDSKIYTGTKTANLTVSWPSQVEYAVLQSKSILEAPPGVFGPADVVMGKVNFSCGFVIDSDNVDKPRTSGLDSWKTEYDDKKMQFYGANTIHVKKTKVLTLADNGTRVECAIGNHTVRYKLRIRMPPRITKTWPPENSTVFVGTNVSCEAEGDPSAFVDLRFVPVFKPAQIIRRKKGSGKVTLPLSLDNPASRYHVACVSTNIFGVARKDWQINVKKRPMNVSFSEVRQQPAGSFLNLSCSTPDPSVEKIFLGFVGRSRLLELRVRPPAFFETSLFGRRLVKLLPYSSRGITVIKVSNRKIDIMIQLTREDNGKEVECVAIARGKRGAVKRNFFVSWPPSVKEVRFDNRRNRFSPVVRFANTTVECKFYLGNPALPMEVVRPSAKIGNRDLGTGYLTSMSPLLHRTWVTQVSRAENGLNVTCSLVNTTLNRTEVIVEKSIVANIQYPPSITLFLPATGAAVLPSSVLRCASDSNPPALVVLSARRGAAPLREVGRGEGAAEGRLSGAEGRYVVTCEAWTELGTVEQSREVVLFARPPAVTLTLSASPIPTGSVHTISCATAASDPLLRQVQLQFHGLNVTLSRPAVSTSNSRSSLLSVVEPNRTEPVLMYNIPASAGSKRLVVRRVSAVSNRIDVKLTVQALDHNQSVTCRAVGIEEGFNVSVRRKIIVSLKPKLVEMWFCLPKGEEYSANKQNNFSIIAKMRIGIPVVKMNVSFVSGDDKETPELQGPRVADRFTDDNGEKYLTQMWNFTASDIDKPPKQIRVGFNEVDGKFTWLTWRLGITAKIIKKLGQDYQCQRVWT